MPQWNCTCTNCVAARGGKIAPQTQSSIAISSETSREWFLINASPDLPRQIESTPPLQPRHGSLRDTPIADVFLTNADIDHALGLLLLRQQETPLVVHAADETRTTLAWIDHLLARFGGIEWRKINSDFQSLSGGLAFRAIELPNSVAFQFRDDISGESALFAEFRNSFAEFFMNFLHSRNCPCMLSGQSTSYRKTSYRMY